MKTSRTPLEKINRFHKWMTFSLLIALILAVFGLGISIYIAQNTPEQIPCIECPEQVEEPMGIPMYLYPSGDHGSIPFDPYTGERGKQIKY